MKLSPDLSVNEYLCVFLLCFPHSSQPRLFLFCSCRFLAQFLADFSNCGCSALLFYFCFLLSCLDLPSMFFCFLFFSFSFCLLSFTKAISCALRRKPNQLYLFSLLSSVLCLILSQTSLSVHRSSLFASTVLLLLLVPQKFLRLFPPYLLFPPPPPFIVSTPRPLYINTSSPVLPPLPLPLLIFISSLISVRHHHCFQQQLHPSYFYTCKHGITQFADISLWIWSKFPLSSFTYDCTQVELRLKYSSS